MPQQLLHLVDDEGRPVQRAVEDAVTNAYRYVLAHNNHIDHALLANMAEHLALAVSRRVAEIHSIQQYALAAMIGKVHEWSRVHPVEFHLPSDQLERQAGAQPDSSFQRIEKKLLLDQMKVDLTERDRHILMLIQQGISDSKSIANALGITNEAAKKAIQRTKHKMMTILQQAGEPNLAITLKVS